MTDNEITRILEEVRKRLPQGDGRWESACGSVVQHLEHILRAMRSPQTYTLIAYRAETHGSRCREATGSEFVNEQELTREKLVEHVAGLLAAEDDYEEVLWFEDRYEAGEWLGQDQFIRDDAQKLVSALRAAAAQRKADAAAAEKRRYQEAQDRADRATYERLQKKFDTGAGT